MASQDQEDIILYDLACTKGVCFSPSVWSIRLMLNYKGISYKTVFLEFPDIESTMKAFGLAPNAEGRKYSVPAIYYRPSDKYIMDSMTIAKFLEETYIKRPVSLDPSSDEEEQNHEDAQATALVLRASLTPREVKILSPRAAEYFRSTREKTLGHSLEDLLPSPEKEDEAWAAVEDKVAANAEKTRKKNPNGPFAAGSTPGFEDFSSAGIMQCTRVIDEGLFMRLYRFPGYREVYDACEPWLRRQD